jgi:hypothetical protein
MHMAQTAPFLGELHCGMTKATVAYCDNVSAVYMSANPIHHNTSFASVFSWENSAFCMFQLVSSMPM